MERTYLSTCLPISNLNVHWLREATSLGVPRLAATEIDAADGGGAG